MSAPHITASPKNDASARSSKPTVSATEKAKLERVYRSLSQTYTTFEETDDPWMTNGLSSTPFKSLVSGCLSTVTVTKRVVNACVPLYEKVSTFEELLALDDEELRRIIKPVAHYNRKTVQLKTMCRQIIDDYGGAIPENRDDLLKLRGVGRKVADLMMNFMFAEDSVAVDTHILRVLNRLGVMETTSATEAADIINVKTPPRYKRHAHEWLIQHGMKVCVARRPKCNECNLTKYCVYFSEHFAA